MNHICSKCEINHENHKIIIFKKIKPNKKRIEEIKNEKLKLNKYKIELNELKDYYILLFGHGAKKESSDPGFRTWSGLPDQWS